MMECQRAKTLEECAAKKNCSREFHELDRACDQTVSILAFMGS